MGRGERLGLLATTCVGIAMMSCAPLDADDALSPPAMQVGETMPRAASIDAGGVAASPSPSAPAEAFVWDLPRGFPRPAVPKDNPMTRAKVELGRHLFYEERLSGNQTFSCATCHEQEHAFADARPVGLGSTGALHTRGSMSLANVGYNPTLTWANPRVTALEAQAHTPLFGTEPVELGMETEAQVEMRLREVPDYRARFAAAFPGEAEPVTMLNVSRALAAFERTLISGRSPYDRWINGEADAIDESAQRGYFLFFSEKLECFHCHGGFNFTDQAAWEGRPAKNPPFHQTGLYDLGGRGEYPAPNTGTHSVTGMASDMGMFKAPTLRNVTRTAPYMHDGSIATLSEVLDHYAAGGRARSARTDALLIGFTLSEEERADMLAFLETFTDDEFLSDPRFADPEQTVRAAP